LEKARVAYARRASPLLRPWLQPLTNSAIATNSKDRCRGSLVQIRSHHQPHLITRNDGELSRVDDLVRKYVEVWNLTPADTTAYLCGHPGMAETGRGMLQRASWKKEHLQFEIYFIPGTPGT
jgi:hypothetical protein